MGMHVRFCKTRSSSEDAFLSDVQSDGQVTVDPRPVGGQLFADVAPRSCPPSEAVGDPVADHVEATSMWWCEVARRGGLGRIVPSFPCGMHSPARTGSTPSAAGSAWG